MTMKICIIHINASKHPSPTIETPPQRFIRHVTPFMNLDVDWDVVRLMDDEFPTDIDQYDGYLITGGSAPLLDEPHPRSLVLIDFIRKLNDAKKPLVGICWGHQVICVALGGTVKKFEKYGMGVRPNNVIKKYDWMVQAPDVVNMFAMHTCQVTDPAPGAELWLSSDFCINGGYTYGDHIMTMQQHPDYNLPTSRQMILSRQDRLPADQYKVALNSLNNPHHSEVTSEWIGAFFMKHKK